MSLGVVVALLGAVGVLAYQALQARAALTQVAEDFESAAESLRSGNVESARIAVESARPQARRARDATDGPLWWLAAHAPVVGDDVAAGQTVADVARVLADDVLPDVLAAGATLSPDRLSPRNGRIGLEPIIDLAPVVVAADEVLQRQSDRVAGIDTAGLMTPVAEPVRQLQAKLAEAAELSSRASHAVRLLPPMLGSEGPRTYLVLFQNNAEIRATGGIPGAVAVVRADDGRLSIGRQGTAADLGSYREPPVPLTRAEVALYESKLGRYGADVNFTPDFPRTAELARAMWREAQGQEVDGVLSADPVALSYLLAATGPVRVPGGEMLHGASAVDVLLNGVYLNRPDGEQQDAFFAGAARAVFKAVVAGDADPVGVYDALKRAGQDGRIFAWSAEADEQALLEETRLGGAVPREARESPYVGVFLNDGTAAKMQYYLDHRVDVRPVGCDAEGRQELEVTLTMSSNAPSNARNLPVSVIGPRAGGEGDYGIRPGYMRINAHLYAPVGGRIDSSALDGEERPLDVVEHLGHPVGSRTVEIGPGETRELTYQVMTGPDQPGEVELRVTPGVRGSGVGEVGPSACSSS